MECKRCGHTLPLTGFICTNCKTMMSAEQIKIQKEQMRINNPNLNTFFVSEKYGHKTILFQKREEAKRKFTGLFIVLGVLLVFLILVFLVYL